MHFAITLKKSIKLKQQQEFTKPTVWSLKWKLSLLSPTQKRKNLTHFNNGDWALWTSSPRYLLCQTQWRKGPVLKINSSTRSGVQKQMDFLSKRWCFNFPLRHTIYPLTFYRFYVAIFDYSSNFWLTLNNFSLLDFIATLVVKKWDKRVNNKCLGNREIFVYYAKRHTIQFRPFHSIESYIE